MSNEIIISVDAGTSIIKAIAFDQNGSPVATASRPNAYHKVVNGGVEQHLLTTWENTLVTLTDLVQQVPDASKNIIALGITGQGDGTWLVDRDNAPVGDALLWLDTRAANVVDEFDAQGARASAYQFTGTALNSCNQSAQLAWLKREQPERLQQADCALHCKDWLYLNLTGERATDVTEGVFTFGNFRTRKYADEVIEAFNLSDCRRLLPTMIDGTQQTHPLSSSVAESTGLPAGIQVALGGVDVLCAALGGGVCQNDYDVGCSVIGTTGMHIKIANDAPNIILMDDVAGYTMVIPGLADTVLRIQSNMSATLNLDWLADHVVESAMLFGLKAELQKTLLLIEGAAESASPGNLFFLPYIEAGERGPFLNVDARAQFSGLHRDINIGQMARAIYEGLAFATRHCYQALGDIPQEVRPVGGGARSGFLRQTLANVLNTRIRVNNYDEPGAIGAAMIAAVAVGRFTDIHEAYLNWVKPNLGPVQTPDAMLRAHYDCLFDAYLTAVDSAAPVWAALAAARASDASTLGVSL